MSDRISPLDVNALVRTGNYYFRHVKITEA